jgi:hypothetical protein
MTDQPTSGTPTRTLLQHAELLAVVRLGPGAEIPAWASAGSIFSVTATATETSIVCGRRGVPKRAPHQGPFTAFSVEGELDFALTGVLAGLLVPLAEAEVPVFTISTYDTDWILVPTQAAETAAEAWRRAGHRVRPAHESADQSSTEGTR